MNMIKSRWLAAVMSLFSLLPFRMALAEVVDNNMFPYQALIFVPCANNGLGENVNLYGVLHTMSIVTNSSSGHGMWKISYQPAATRGTGEITGNTYYSTGGNQITATYDGIDAFPFEQNIVNNILIIGQGTANNFTLHVVWHITVNADGTVTASVLSSNVQCK